MRWLSLTDAQGNGIAAVTLDDPLQVNMTRCSYAVFLQTSVKIKQSGTCRIRADRLRADFLTAEKLRGPIERARLTCCIHLSDVSAICRSSSPLPEKSSSGFRCRRLPDSATCRGSQGCTAYRLCRRLQVQHTHIPGVQARL